MWLLQLRLFSFLVKKRRGGVCVVGHCMVTYSFRLYGHHAHSRDFCVCYCCEVDHKDWLDLLSELIQKIAAEPFSRKSGVCIIMLLQHHV